MGHSLSSAFPVPFPVPFALSRGPASKNVFLASFVETNKMEPTNPNANTYVNPLCIERDTAG